MIRLSSSSFDFSSLKVSEKSFVGTGQNVDHPYQISKYEDYVGRPFNDLWDYIENITAQAGTFSRFLEPQFVDINAKLDGRKRVAFLYSYNEWWSGIFSNT